MNPNSYTKFDSRLAIELERRDEVRSCGGCLLGIGEMIGGTAAAIFGGAGGIAVGTILVTAGVDEAANNC
jgi:hypothetical protein